MNSQLRKFFLSCFIALSALAIAQPTDSTEHYLLNFSVPDMPAFKALGTEPSNISRPSDIQKFAVTMAPFYSGGKAIIPQNFAMELAPWKLGSKKWTLQDYEKKSILYNSAFSVGSIRDTSDYSSKLSVGYRVTISCGKHDVLKNATLMKKIAMDIQDMDRHIINLQNKWVTEIKKKTGFDAIQYTKTHLQEFLEYLSKQGAGDIQSNSMKADYDSLMTFIKEHKMSKKELFKDTLSYYKMRNTNIDSMLTDYKNNSWNATRSDIAIAWTGASSDTLLANAQFSSFNLWLTQSIAVHKGGQLLIGVNGKLPRTEFIKPDSVDRKIDASICLRYYAGTKDVRGFLETQYKYQNITRFNQTLLINLGAEFRINKKFWIIASGGVNNYLGETKPFSKLISSINLRYAFNEPNK